MSRPKTRKVLVFSTLEQGMGATLFVLNNRGYGLSRGLHAIAVHSVRDFSTEIAAFPPDAALLFYDGDADAVRACEWAARCLAIPVLVACRKDAPADLSAAMVLPPKGCSMAEILYALRVVLMRKLGPKSTPGARPAVANHEAVLA